METVSSMLMSEFRWSISSLNNFKTCPLKYYHENVLGIKTPPGEAAIWGNEVHKALEDAVADGQRTLENRYELFQTKLDKVYTYIDAGWTPIVERKYAVDRDLKLVDFDASDAWGRSIVDLTLTYKNVAVILDYKTGKVPQPKYQDYGQLSLSSLCILKSIPEIQTVKSKYWYITHNKVSDTVTTTRSNEYERWRIITAQVADAERCFTLNRFEPKRNGLCKAYCPVTSCMFNGKYTRG